MEHSLTYSGVDMDAREYVLILVLMEHSLTEVKPVCRSSLRCLNPYSNGTLSDSDDC